MWSQVGLRGHHYNKASGGGGIPAELFQILKDNAVKVLHSICQQIWKTQQWPQDWKSQFLFQSQRKAVPKNAQSTAPLCSSHTLVLKILQARLQQYMNRELLDAEIGFRKGRRTKIKLPTSVGSWKKQESSRKTCIPALLTMPKPLTVWITINCGKFFKRWEYQTTWPASWEICMHVKK